MPARVMETCYIQNDVKEISAGFLTMEQVEESLGVVAADAAADAVAFGRQTSSLSAAYGICRQLTADGFNRQLTADGFCRQLTEQMWPTYNGYGQNVEAEPCGFMEEQHLGTEVIKMPEPSFTRQVSAPEATRQCGGAPVAANFRRAGTDPMWSMHVVKEDDEDKIGGGNGDNSTDANDSEQEDEKSTATDETPPPPPPPPMPMDHDTQMQWTTDGAEAMPGVQAMPNDSMMMMMMPCGMYQQQQQMMWQCGNMGNMENMMMAPYMVFSDGSSYPAAPQAFQSLNAERESKATSKRSRFRRKGTSLISLAHQEKMRLQEEEQQHHQETAAAMTLASPLVEKKQSVLQGELTTQCTPRFCPNCGGSLTRHLLAHFCERCGTGVSSIVST